jgi:hypothetical protein
MDYLNSLEKPVMKISGQLITPNPSINGPSAIFKGKQSISISNSLKDAQIYYTTDGSTPSKASLLYTQPFEIDKSSQIKAIAYKEGYVNSFPVEASYQTADQHYTIQVKTAINPTFTGGGNNALVDGVRGTANYKIGDIWQGFRSPEIEAVVDLGLKKKVNTVSIGALQDTNAWIIIPSEVRFYGSSDNINFVEIGKVKSTVDPKDERPQIQEFSAKAGIECRYIKVVVRAYGILGDWHDGSGELAHSFFDEITIN